MSRKTSANPIPPIGAQASALPRPPTIAGARPRVLIVPGFRGSGAQHWQTWFEGQLPEASRVGRIDWGAPVLIHWAREIRNEIESSRRPVWLIAHSFGCLAAVHAVADRDERIAGAMLVAPADPERFSPSGLKPAGSPRAICGLSPHLPRQPLRFPSMVVASANDPWIDLGTAAYWADLWDSRFVIIGDAGHINVDSGFGPWPEGIELFRSLQAQRQSPWASAAKTFPG